MIQILSFLGTLFGIILSKIAPEELKPGNKYIILFKRITIFFILIIPTYYFKISIIYLILGLIISFFLRKPYLYLGLTLILSFQIKELSIIIASLIFIYGLSYGILIKKKLNLLIDLVLFIIPLILFYNNLYITYNSEIFSFILGALIVQLKYDK